MFFKHLLLFTRPFRHTVSLSVRVWIEFQNEFNGNPCLKDLNCQSCLNSGIYSGAYVLSRIFENSQEGGGNLEAAIEQLLNEEKQMRLAGDVGGTKKAVTDILQLCFEARAWKTLNDQIVLLSKRRGQLKQVPQGFWRLGFAVDLLLWSKSLSVLWLGQWVIKW